MVTPNADQRVLKDLSGRQHVGRTGGESSADRELDPTPAPVSDRVAETQPRKSSPSVRGDGHQAAPPPTTARDL